MTQRIFLFAVLFSLSAFAGDVTDTRNEDDSNADGHQVLVKEARLRMPAGTSTWEDSFPATGSSPLRILYVKETSCPRSPGMNVFVRTTGSTHWQPTRLVNGYDYYEGTTIEAIRFEIVNPYLRPLTCTWKIYADEGATEPPPVSTNEELAGAINYAGGFAHNMELPVSPALNVTHLRFAVPQFCEGLEVLEASTVTEGVKDKATMLSKEQNLFGVNQGNGARISKIFFSANGPVGKPCQIPVYVKVK